ncbi:MAG: Nif3-like dinuclear metal center hexameric protein, partial [Cruoricaptor ignavus]|nr:Nif3-like dinuclear metal center hexameric protein [Cruoricaptor ignavus]
AHPYEEVAYQIYTLENENQYSGLGRYGELKEEMHEMDFMKMVKEKFGLQVIRHSATTGKKIKKVGVLGGSGASGIKNAMAKKCDAYLTGDVKYHDFFLAEQQMLICDIGHLESEQFVVQQLFDIFSENFPKFAISKSEENTNPVNYFL